MIPQATSTDYMVPEVNMNKLRIASAVAALTSALAIPAWGADATNAAKDGVSKIDQPVQQSGPVTPRTALARRGRTQTRRSSATSPTSAMDSATPPDKTTNGKASDEASPDVADGSGRARPEVAGIGNRRELDRGRRVPRNTSQ